MKFCNKCGNALEPTDERCAACGEAVTEEIASSIVETGTKKPKKKLVAILTAIAVLLAAGVLAFFTLPVFQNFIMRSFTPKSTYLGYVLKQNLGSADSISDIFDSTFNSDLKITASDDFIDMLTKNSGLDDTTLSIIKAIDNIELSTSSRFNETQYANSITARLNGAELGTADLATDFENRLMFVNLNDLNDKAFASEIDESTAETSLMVGKGLTFVKNNEKDIKALSGKYAKTALSDLKIEKSSETLEAGGYPAKYTKLAFTIDEETTKNILKDVLTSAGKDKKLKGIITEAFKLDEESDFSESDIDEAINDALDDVETIEFDSEIKVALFVDNTAKIKGVTIDEEDSGFSLSCADVTKGFNFATDMSVSFEDITVTVTGSGTEKSKKRTGEYILSASDGGEAVDYCKIGLSDFSTEAPKGQLSLSLTENAYKLLPADIDETAASLLKDGNIALNIDKADKKGAEGSVALRFKDADLANIDFKSSRTAGSEISIPEDYTEDALEWGGNFDFFAIMSRVKGAGIPLTSFLPF